LDEAGEAAARKTQVKQVTTKGTAQADHAFEATFPASATSTELYVVDKAALA
jgi:hypothetical protein